MNTNNINILFPAEWHPQSGVQLTWPHAGTDWKNNLEEVTPCYVTIAQEIAKREKVVIVCHDQAEIREKLSDIDSKQLIFREIQSNDTWARDHGAISIIVDEKPYIYDFTFNGWGMKFAANLDNQITRQLHENGTFAEEVKLLGMKHCVLEGGSIESDGCGTLLTTSECLLSHNRNDYKGKEELADYLTLIFNAQRVLWLDHGYLRGDDTDSHIDTLARFCDPETIAYVKCEDNEDEHYEALLRMEKQLQTFKTSRGKSYCLVPLPMADIVEYEGERLPATYANFLIINGAVLLPFYDSPKDEIAKKTLKAVFPDREIIGINCIPLIKQHGSLHCVTMQFPIGFIL